jgi:dihydrolipoamide dehydrogenase
VIFTDPEVATVGLSEREARAAGVDLRIAEVELSSAAGASLAGETTTGRARLVIDGTRQVVVGATFVGPDVAELLHAATIAVVAEVPLARLWHRCPHTRPCRRSGRLLEAAGRGTAELDSERTG